MLNVAIVGGSGYTGLELLRILTGHPNVKVVEITSRQYKEKTVASVFPHLKGFYGGLVFSNPEEFKNLKADLVFCALPHGASQEVVPVLLNAGKKVVDLSRVGWAVPTKMSAMHTCKWWAEPTLR